MTHIASRLDRTDLVAVAERTLRENGFEPEFSAAVDREISAMSETAPEVSRDVRDLRGLLWSSIDNRESRDLDQIEIAERLGGDLIRVRVGIADVDSLVPKGSATDDHAAMNTTSVYTGVAVFPMLPERLSTDLTSLNQGHDRHGVVVEMDVARDGTVVAYDTYRALLRNQAKLDYDSVGAWLDGWGPVPAAVALLPGLEDQLRLQQEAAVRLREFRRRSGALEIDGLEARPVTVGRKIIDIEVVRRNGARDLIEVYMVAANNATARHLLDRGIPSIRRVVRTPRRWSRIVAIAAEVRGGSACRPSRKAVR